jgi:CHAD domain-containing protein
MAPTISSLGGKVAKSIGLEVWMDRVVERADRIDPEWRAGDIHDLRVALRRCRTMAETLSEVVPDPGWRKLKKASRELFHALGNLRDTQVERALIKKLETPGDPLRKYMLRHLGREEKKQRNAAQKALESFDRKNWRKSSRKLSSKAQFFPVESVVFQRIALAMLNEAAHLYQSAREKKSSVAWHKTRIGIKRFRYVVENFLPQRHEVWAKDLKQMQDLLGDLHDMDVLRGDTRGLSKKFAPAVISASLEKIDAQRKRCLRDFLAKTSGEQSPWIIWRAGFQWGHPVAAAAPPARRTA